MLTLVNCGKAEAETHRHRTAAEAVRSNAAPAPETVLTDSASLEKTEDFKERFWEHHIQAVMQSQGSTSSQPSFDSLSSSDSFLFSDSEQAEDDSDVFLTDTSSSVIIGGTSGAMPDGDTAMGSPRSQWTCDNLTDKEEEEEGYRSESISKRSTDKSEPTSRIPKTQGDLLFAQKCAELQGFVRPLLELLNGLKKGRFDRGLSSFQQSVAMDRIQRIVGVLQRPTCGEKYLNTLLQVEVMLKLWFPQIQTFPVSAASSVATSPALSLHDTAGFTPPHKNKDQSHIPVKKRRLSWTGTDSPTPSPVLLKSPRVTSDEDKNIKHSSSATSERSNTSTNSSAEDADQQGKLSKCRAHCSEPSLTWVHVAPILSLRKSTSSSLAGNGDKKPTPTTPSVQTVLQHTHPSSPATQDSSVSSTTTKRNQKINTKLARCQSQPSAAQVNDNDSSRSKPSSEVMTLPRARPTPLET